MENKVEEQNIFTFLQQNRIKLRNKTFLQQNLGDNLLMIYEKGNVSSGLK